MIINANELLLKLHRLEEISQYVIYENDNEYENKIKKLHKLENKIRNDKLYKIIKETDYEDEMLYVFHEGE